MWLLAQILTEITRKPRYQVKAGRDFKWSKSWIYNLFRIYELTFWRRFDIKLESTAAPGFHKSYTWENFSVVLEERLRAFKLPKFSIEYVPVFRTVGMPLPIPTSLFPYRLAIAFDIQAGKTTLSVTNDNYSHTVTGSNPVLVAGLATAGTNGNANDPSSIIYNSVAMSQVGNISINGSDRRWFAYYKSAVSTGANTFSYTFSTSKGRLSACTASYSGVSQTDVPDSKIDKQQAATNFTQTATVVASNCWLWAGESNDSGTPTAGAGLTLRSNGGAVDAQIEEGDSNATVGTGSQSMTFNSTGSWTFGGTIISMAPSGGAVTRMTLPILGAS